jgi:hypothetical protein
MSIAHLPLKSPKCLANKLMLKGSKHEVIAEVGRAKAATPASLSLQDSFYDRGSEQEVINDETIIKAKDIHITAHFQYDTAAPKLQHD